MELKMPNKTPDQENELAQRVRASLAHTDRQQSTSNESQPSHDGGFVAMLWLLALMIAEIEFWILAFAHIYRT
jgi:hypothetical protein